jgi:hypothetical protein
MQPINKQKETVAAPRFVFKETPGHDPTVHWRLTRLSRHPGPLSTEDAPI